MLGSTYLFRNKGETVEDPKNKEQVTIFRNSYKKNMKSESLF